MMEYLTTFDYYPRGDSENAIRSRTICSHIKAGREESINHRIDSLLATGNDGIGIFLNPAVTLVPVPRSSPIAGDAIWPAMVICRILLERRLCRDVVPLIGRTTPLRKASLQRSADERPSVNEHFESMRINPSLLPFDQFTLVDDVLTQGRTTYACFQKLFGAYPDIEIRAFAMARTKSFFTGTVTNIFNLEFGQIGYNPNSGKTNIYP